MICSCNSDENNDGYIKQAQSIEQFETIYKVGSVIGRGQFSEVKVAEGPKGSIAVKCIKLSAIRNEFHLLKREITIMHKIRHPNVVELYDIYENEEFFYIAMELCPNGNLKQFVRESGPLSDSDTKIIAIQILNALEYIHSQKICHRDVKPENILFKGGIPKLADFGLARVMSGTSKFSMVGTPYYLAPEVISGDYNMKCDIWSLGVVIYYAITGKRPFVGEGYEELFAKIQSTEISWENVPEDAQDFLRYLLRKDYKLRPNAHEALDHKWLT